ncbi:hypothetical protein HYFRA_00002998 [Hymenoscyphus fraxineus]|uniref:LEA domain protein n=1 Tax=Hymenoscyphus fraxineus TaxID=746836 RepID=A0A9N9PPM3_9HELO|nr:hypothetical protein HYFRA_00002998 [Hymenoscyphus fraxineus]
MSFLTRTTPLLRTPIATRAFSTSYTLRKVVPEPVVNAAKTVDRKVSDVLVDGIEVGQNAAQKAKEVAGMSSSEAKGKASELAGQAKGKANEVAGNASEMAGQAKGKANEMAGEAKGKSAELKGEAKSKM